MANTIHIKWIMKEELYNFKSRPDIYFPNLELSSKAIELMMAIAEEFVRNIIVTALHDVKIEKRLMPEHINKVLEKRLDIQFVDAILPKPADMTLYTYKPRKTAKSELKSNTEKSANLTN